DQLNAEILTSVFRDDGVVRVDDASGSSAVRSYLSAPVHSHSGEVLGALLFGHTECGAFTDADKDLLGAIATQAGVAIDNAKAHVELEAEIAARRRAQQIEHFLARCTVTLASSLDYERNLATLAEMAVPFLADICLIDVMEDDEMRRVGAAHV